MKNSPVKHQEFSNISKKNFLYINILFNILVGSYRLTIIRLKYKHGKIPLIIFNNVTKWKIYAIRTIFRNSDFLQLPTHKIFFLCRVFLFLTNNYKLRRNDQNLGSYHKRLFSKVKFNNI